jgi:Derlin-2/3
MLIFGAALTIAITTYFPTFTKIKFLGHPLAFMMVYVWGRGPENAHVRMGFLGIFPFSAPYLPWVLLLFSLVIGNPVETDLLGIIVGHIYYFLEFVYPHVATIRGWRIKKIIHTPSFLHYLCGTRNFDNGLNIPQVSMHKNDRYITINICNNLYDLYCLI